MKKQLKYLGKKLLRYIEIIYYNILIYLFNYYQDKSVIPDGHYCYNPLGIDDKTYIVKIKPCKYYRHLFNDNKGCTFLGIYKYDIGLYDQCKACGINLKD